MLRSGSSPLFSSSILSDAASLITCSPGVSGTALSKSSSKFFNFLLILSAVSGFTSSLSIASCCSSLLTTGSNTTLGLFLAL
jgi:preprotein translocase subunit SecF